MQEEQKEIFAENFSELCMLIAKNNDEKLLQDFFDCLFSPSEIIDISKRWLLVKELDEGVVQRDIASKYNISLCKISRGVKELKKEDSAFIRMLNLKKKILGKELNDK